MANKTTETGDNLDIHDLGSESRDRDLLTDHPAAEFLIVELDIASQAVDSQFLVVWILDTELHIKPLLKHCNILRYDIRDTDLWPFHIRRHCGASRHTYHSYRQKHTQSALRVSHGRHPFSVTPSWSVTAKQRLQPKPLPRFFTCMESLPQHGGQNIFDRLTPGFADKIGQHPGELADQI